MKEINNLGAENLNSSNNESLENIHLVNKNLNDKSFKSENLLIALKPKSTLLIGAGKVAAWKFKVLSEAGFKISVVASEIKDEFFKHKEVKIINFKLENKDLKLISDENLGLDFLKEFDVIVDASGDLKLGAFLYAKRKEFGYLLNVVDVPKLCDFYFGASTRNGDISVLVSSNGTSPILAQSIRDKIKALLPRLNELTSFFKKTRTKGGLSEVQKVEIKRLCKQNLGKVFIIGCGPGDFKSLTLKAYERLDLIEIALIDNLVGDEIKAYLEKKGVECISVAKQKGKVSFRQKDINELLLKFAKEGRSVGRLKGGDAALFGRAWEEASFLKERGIEVECINGTSSAFVVALTSGIVPTIRGVSSGVLIVSAHLRENIFHTEWLEYLKNPPYTLIVLMVHSFAARVVEEAKKLGIDLELDAAFVSKIDSPEQRSIIGKLGELESMAALCEQPAILIIGKAVARARKMPHSDERIVLEESLKEDLKLVESFV